MGANEKIISLDGLKHFHDTVLNDKFESLNEKISNIISGMSAEPIKFKGYVNVNIMNISVGEEGEEMYYTCDKSQIDSIYDSLQVGEACLVAPSMRISVDGEFEGSDEYIEELKKQGVYEDSYLAWIATAVENGEPLPICEELLKTDASNILKGEVRTYFVLDKDNPYWQCPDMLLLAKIKVKIKPLIYSGVISVPEAVLIALNLLPDDTEITTCVGKILRWSAGDWLVKNINNFAPALKHSYEPYNTSPNNAWETGIIAYTLINGPIGGERFTIIVNASSDTDSNGNTTVQQIAYGRTGTASGRVWTRIGFSGTWNNWIEISNNNDLLKNILPNVNGWLLNPNDCLNTGVYQTCNSGALNGLLTNNYFTLFVNASTTPNGDGYDAIEQTAYGRGADEGKIYRRVIFYHKTNEIRQYGEWVDISYKINPIIILDYDVNTNRATPRNVTTWDKDKKSFSVGKSIIWSNNHTVSYSAPTIKTNDEFITIGKDGLYSVGFDGGTFTKIPFEGSGGSGESSDVQKSSIHGDLNIDDETFSVYDSIENLSQLGLVYIYSANDESIGEFATSLIDGEDVIVITSKDYFYIFVMNESGEWVLDEKRPTYSERYITKDDVATDNDSGIIMLGTTNISNWTTGTECPVRMLGDGRGAYAELRIGSGLTSNRRTEGGDGSLSVNIGTGMYFDHGSLSLGTATTTSLGGVKIGYGIAVDNGTISIPNKNKISVNPKTTEKYASQSGAVNSLDLSTNYIVANTSGFTNSTIYLDATILNKYSATDQYGECKILWDNTTGVNLEIGTGGLYSKFMNEGLSSNAAAAANDMVNSNVSIPQAITKANTTGSKIEIIIRSYGQVSKSSSTYINYPNYGSNSYIIGTGIAHKHIITWQKV